jgi:hypothetical protein
MANPTHPLHDHRRLEAFIGSWAGEEHVAASAWTVEGMARGEVLSECLFGGLFIEQHYRQTCDGLVSFEARNIIGFDAADRAYKLYQFDTVGFTPPSPASGQWENDALIFERSSPRGVQRTVYHFANTDCYRMDVSFQPAGGTDWQEVVSGVYRRLPSNSTNIF